MSSHNETQSFYIFGAVLGALVLFTLFIGVMANAYSPSSDPLTDPLIMKQQQERIMPVGRSRIAE